MKKHVALILLSLMLFLLSGCYSAIPEMTEEEEARLTQYMADLILEYDVNYQSTYLQEKEKAEALVKEDSMRKKAEEIREEEERIRKEKQEANKPDEIEISSESAGYEGELSLLSEYLGFESLETEYLGYSVCMRYPQEEEVVSFAMTPSDGNEFVVLKFSLQNITESEFLADTLELGDYFVLRMNESVQRRALTTLLENDLSIYADEIQPGEQKEVVLVFEKPLDVELNSLALEVRSISRDVYKKIPLE